MSKTKSLKLEADLFLDIKNDLNVPYCDEKEEKELIELLNELTDDELKIVKYEKFVENIKSYYHRN